MTMDPHAEAVRIHGLFVAAGYAWFNKPDSAGHVWPDVSFSTNRHGEKSAYFDVRGGRVRISDHGCNTDWRSEIMLPMGLTTEDVAEIAARWAVQDSARKEQKAREEAERDAYEEAFKASFLRAWAANNGSWSHVVAECWPQATKSQRQAVKNRWAEKWVAR